MKKHGIKLAVVALISLVFLFLFFRKVDWGQFLRYATSANPFLFALIILLAPLHLATRALRWHVLLRYQKKGVRFASTFSAQCRRIHRVQHLPRPARRDRQAPLPGPQGGPGAGLRLGTVVVERIFDIFTMCVLLGIFLLARPLYASAFGLSPETLGRLVFWGRIGVALRPGHPRGLPLPLFLQGRGPCASSASLLKPFPRGFAARALELAREFIDGLTFFRTVGRCLPLYGLLSLVVWLGIVLYYWVFFFAYHVSRAVSSSSSPTSS